MWRHIIPATADAGYALGEELGRGASGTVFAAVHRATGREVAIKFLHDADDPDERERFRREGEMMGRIFHVNVARVLETGVMKGLPYMITERCSPRTLADQLTLDTLSMGQITTGLIQILAGVQACHRAGIVHRDLKPGNILVGPTGQLCITDFGLATFAGGTGLTRPGQVMGTPRYLAPEQAAGDACGTPDSDVYAVGCIAFEMLTGRPPFTGSTIVGTLHQHVSAPVPDLAKLAPGAPARLVRVVLRALSKDPHQRPTAAEMSAEVAAAQRPAARRVRRSAPAPARSVSCPVASPAPRWSWQMVAVAALAALWLARAGFAG